MTPLSPLHGTAHIVCTDRDRKLLDFMVLTDLPILYVKNADEHGGGPARAI